MLRAEVQQVCAAAGEVRGLVVRCDGAPVTMSAASVIDCSGVGSIASLLGHPMISDGTYQSAAQVVRLDRVGPIEEYALGLALRRALLRASNVPASYKRSSIVQGSLRNGRVDLKIPLIGAISDDPAVVATLKHEIDEALPVLMPVIRQIESLRGADVHTIFPTPGVRVQQRPKGEYVLTAQDVLSCRKSADGIAVGVWPVEEWDYEGKVRLDCFAPNDGYEIPAGCLKSPVFHNLYFGGKGISAETRAIASARVTGTCLQTGYAAGKVAACKSEGERRDVIAEIHSQFGEKRG
jgi:hypothetical protein